MNRNPDSHKGENGRVMVIGGSAMFHGAPILSALGAEYSGADLVYPFLPPCHAEVARTYSLNFIVRTFKKDRLTKKDVKDILEFSENTDAVVIGPGLGDAKDTVEAVKILLAELKKSVVADADALIYTNSLPEICVLTPHRGEFKKLTGDDPAPENVQKWARNLNATIICKGPEDIIADNDKIIINETGNALMTVGGTGDVLSGLIGGLMAQKYPPAEACRTAARVLGLAADRLAGHQNSLTAHELARMIPKMLHE